MVALGRNRLTGARMGIRFGIEARGVFALFLVACSGAGTDRIEPRGDSATAPGPPNADAAAHLDTGGEAQTDAASGDATIDSASDARIDVSVQDGPGTSQDAATRADASDAAEASDAGNDVRCVPVTRQVACANGRCGMVPDGCGGSHACGGCVSPMTCVANACVCANETDATYCAAHGYNCGTVTDSCLGATRRCGSCTAPQTCGGGGKANVCGCTPLAGCPAGDNCGSVPDGCGGTNHCGTCTGSETCAGAGVPNHCGCTPRLVCPTSACGMVSNGCGNTLDCGSCSAWQVCGSPGDGGGNGCATPNACCDVCTRTMDLTCVGTAVVCDPSVTLGGSCAPGATTDGGGVEWCCP